MMGKGYTSEHMVNFIKGYISFMYISLLNIGFMKFLQWNGVCDIYAFKAFTCNWFHDVIPNGV